MMCFARKLTELGRVALAAGLLCLALLGGCARDTSEATLVFAGDVMFARNVGKSIETAGRDYSFLFEEVAQYFRAADIAFCNLECSLTERGTTWKNKNMFRASPESANALALAGIDVVSLANNHVLDYKKIGLDDTRAAVDLAGVRYVGLTEAGVPQRPVIIETNGVRVGYLAYCGPAAYYENLVSAHPTRPITATKELVARDVDLLRDKADIIVVSMHWGEQGETEHSEFQQTLGHFMIEQGVDIVAGHHAHVLQGTESYKGGLILYGMGNFIFDQRADRNRQSRIYRVVVNKKGLVRAEYLPVEITKGTWQPVPTAPNYVPL